MKMHLIKRVTAGAIAAALCLCLGASAIFASGNGAGNRLQLDELKRADAEVLPVKKGKTEVIYAKLNEDGGVETAFVVNRVTPEPGKNLEDFGDYSDVSQISLNGSLKRDGDKVTFETGDQNFYYQGKLKDTELPWVFGITYKLDGKQVEPDVLSGADGALEINISVKANPKCRESKDGTNPWAKVNMLQMSVTFPEGTTANLEAKDGTIALSGSNQLVNFIYLPNSDPKTFTIKATVTDFHMPPMQFAGVPFSFDFDSIKKPDLSKNEEVKKLKDGTKKLADGSEKLYEGLEKLKDGGQTLKNTMSELTSGGNKLSDNSSALTDGLDKLSSGASELAANGKRIETGIDDSASGASQLADGMQKAADGLTAYVDGVKTYASGIKQLAQNLPTMGTGVTQLTDAARQLAAGADKLSQGAELAKGSAEIRKGMEQIAAGLGQAGTPEEMAALKAKLKTLGENAAKLGEASANFKKAIDELNTGISGLSMAADGLYDGLGQVIKAVQDNINQPMDVKQLVKESGISYLTLALPDVQKLLKYIQQKQTAGMEQLLAGLQQLHSSADPAKPAPAQILKDALAQMKAKLPQLAEGYTQFDAGIQELAKGLPQLAKLGDLLDLAGGLKTLSANYQKFDDGVQAYVTGVNQLLAQLKPLPQGSTGQNLYSGIMALGDGFKQLAENSGKLSQGADQLSGANADALVNGQKALKDGASRLSGGLHDLSSGFSQFNGGVSSLASGATQLSTGLGSYLDGVRTLASGLSRWAEGFDTYADGVSSAADGSQALASGTQELHRGTQTMDQSMIELMEKYLADYQQLDEPKPSFASDKNPAVDHVQFVVMSQAVEKAPKETIPEPPEKEFTFWDRFINLFKGNK